MSVFALVATGYSILLFVNGELFYPGFILFFCISFLFLLLSTISTYRKTKDRIKTYEIDIQKNRYTISETSAQEAALDLRECICYKIKKRTVSKQSDSSGSDLRIFWDLFFLKSDGAFYLLESFSSREELKQNLVRFRALLPLPVSDEESKEIPEASNSSPAQQTSDLPKLHSKYLKFTVTPSGTRVELIKHKTIKEKFTISLIMGIFYGAWGVAASFIKDADPIFLLFFVPFSILFLGIFTIALVFVITRSLELFANSSGLRIRYRTTLPILSSFLFLERFFPAHVVRHVRANLFPLDQSVLTVSLKENHKNPKGILSFLFNLQAFSLKDYVLPGDGELLGIWHLMPWLPDSPGLADLIAAESAIEEQLNLSEEKIRIESWRINS